MDYTGTSGTAAMTAGGATLAYTGVNQATMVWLILAAVLIAAGLVLLAVSRRHTRRDALAAGIGSSPELVLLDE